MSATKRPGRPSGTAKPGSKSASVRFRCTDAQKRRWVASARDKGMKLSEWVVAQLND